MIYNIIVLLFEVLYYSMFMYYARKEGKFWRYLLLFSLITIVLIFIGTNNLYAYLIFVLLSLYGLKYIVKINISLYDMLIVFIMLIINFLIPTPLSIILFKLNINVFLITIINSIIKVIIIFLLRNILHKFYNKFKKIWDKNIFYIRYLFIIFMFSYIIFTCIYFIFIM